VVRAAHPCTRRQLVLSLQREPVTGPSVALCAPIRIPSTQRRSHQRKLRLISGTSFPIMLYRLPRPPATVPCSFPSWIADGGGPGALVVPMVDCRRRRHRLPVRPHGGRPTAPAPAPCASPWWTADGAGTGALYTSMVDCRRCRHRRPVRPHCERPTAPASALCATPWWIADGGGTGALCVPMVDGRRRRHRRHLSPRGGHPTTPASVLSASRWLRAGGAA